MICWIMSRFPSSDSCASPRYIDTSGTRAPISFSYLSAPPELTELQLGCGSAHQHHQHLNELNQEAADLQTPAVHWRCTLFVLKKSSVTINYPRFVLYELLATINSSLGVFFLQGTSSPSSLANQLRHRSPLAPLPSYYRKTFGLNSDSNTSMTFDSFSFSANDQCAVWQPLHFREIVE